MASRRRLIYFISCIEISLWVVPVTAASIATYSGFSGCLFSSSLCRFDENCFDDNLFGTCSGTSEGRSYEGYRYHLDGQQLTELETNLQQLVADGYTWRHLYTQCVLAESLSAYRRGALVGSNLSFCEKYLLVMQGHHSQLPDEDFNYLKPVSGRRDFGYSRNAWANTTADSLSTDSTDSGRNSITRNVIRGAYEEFAKFITKLSPEDLRDLKDFLVDESVNLKSKKAVKVISTELTGAPLLLQEGTRQLSEVPVTQALPTIDLKYDNILPGHHSYEYTAPDKKSEEPTKTNASGNFNNQDTGFQVQKGKHVQDKQDDVILYILFGTLGILVAVFIVTFIQYFRICHKRNRPDHKLIGSSDHIDDAYEDLCREHMTAKFSETPTKLLGSEKTDSGSKQPPIRMENNAAVWKEAPIVNQIDISAGTVFLSYMEDHLRDAGRLEREWAELSTDLSDVELTCFSSVAFEPANALKNRCSDIIPYEKSRVKLIAEMNSVGSDYINANYIIDDDPRKPAYIATQGPLGVTVADFWQMIWEQGSTVIINLSCLVEDTVSLCHRYWPETGSDLYHIYEVTLLSEHDYCDDYVIRNFSVRNTETKGVHDVTQFHYLAWPALQPAVPESVPGLMEFRRRVKRSFSSGLPAVIHCSDGAGRTGTYCLIDMVLDRLCKGVKQVDIAASLEHLRDQRHNMVQTKEQFEFAFMAVAQEVYAMLCNPEEATTK